jgi:hypothetical protein
MVFDMDDASNCGRACTTEDTAKFANRPIILRSGAKESAVCSDLSAILCNIRNLQRISCSWIKANGVVVVVQHPTLFDNAINGCEGKITGQNNVAGDLGSLN